MNIDGLVPGHRYVVTGYGMRQFVGPQEFPQFGETWARMLDHGNVLCYVHPTAVLREEAHDAAVASRCRAQDCWCQS